MEFIVGQYEFKHVGENSWQKVSEKIVLESLVDHFERVIPIISRMLRGEEIITSRGIYRKII